MRAAGSAVSRASLGDAFWGTPFEALFLPTYKEGGPNKRYFGACPAQ